MNIAKNVLETIGKTPLIEICNLEKKEQLKARVLVKMEGMNPGGSVKDRPAFWMVQKAEELGALKPGGTIIEPTSGNTGIGIAMVAAAKGYQTIFTMPETMSEERRKFLSVYGAQVVLTKGTEGMKGAIARADELQKEISGSVILGQFVNEANAYAHKMTTGPEIWEDTDGTVDVFVSGIGTGGTITGTGEYLKQQNAKIEIVAVEPDISNVLSGGNPGPHKIQGIGAGFIPKILNTEIYDKVEMVSSEEAYEMSKKLIKIEGIFAGISSGGALAVAIKLAKQSAYENKTIVVMLPDSGDRYLSVY
jgi:cysteine synthase A